jgi:hypothetical protein
LGCSLQVVVDIPTETTLETEISLGQLGVSSMGQSVAIHSASFGARFALTTSGSLRELPTVHVKCVHADSKLAPSSFSLNRAIN